MHTYKILVKGIVQGVGFRPYVYKIASLFKLNGYVNNDDIGVNIIVNAKEDIFKHFIKKLRSNFPVLSKIDSFEFFIEKNLEVFTSFEIRKSETSNNKSTLISSDIAICTECENDIKDENNHRFNYSLTNCTNCGPRYSIIKTIPYDRANTSMSNFILCKTCKDEYENPLNRRYHAQPLACEKCGPELFLYDNKSNLICKNEKVLDLIVSKINKGLIVCIKGMGGFHLVCDATNDKSIQKLRELKNRKNKPFAVMFKNIRDIKKHTNINKKEEEIISSNNKPITLVNQNLKSDLSSLIAPNIDRLGVFLPYTALHILLFQKLLNPIILSSANLKDEPIITSYEEVLEKLPFITYVLDFNRDIINACDDSVVQVVNNKIQVLRSARAYSPSNLKTNMKFKKNILALGANQKSTISIAFNKSIITSPYIADLNSIKAFEYFKKTIKTFERFYDFKAEIIVCDKHPLYESTKFANTFKDIKIIQIQHHYAHALSCMAEFNLSRECLCFIFDGTGYGDDGNIWGGEVFLADNKKYKRIHHIKNFKLLGGEKAVKEPKRVALSLLFDCFNLDEILNMNNACVNSFSKKEINVFYKMHKKSLNSPLCSSMGRIFDAISSFANILHIQSYEGETGLLIEKNYDVNINEAFSYEINEKDIDLSLMIKEIIRLKDKKLICTMFLNMIINIIVEISSMYKNKSIILSGGVFQNKTLLENLSKKLNLLKKDFYYTQKVPLNDSSISLGQIYSQL